MKVPRLRNDTNLTGVSYGGRLGVRARLCDFIGMGERVFEERAVFSEEASHEVLSSVVLATT